MEIKRWTILGLVFFIFSFSLQSMSQLETNSQAKWMLERLTGVRWPGNGPVLLQMSDLLSKGKKSEAIQLALAQPQFLNITVKQLALKMSSREENLRTEFNDFSATFMGITRDNLDSRELLTGNYFYMADPSKLPNIPSNLIRDILTSNNHYKALDNKSIDIGSILIKVNGQSVMNSNSTAVANPDPAGVLTSRAFMSAHAFAGTNRRPVEFAIREFACLPIEKWADTSASENRIGRDIDRFPGGDHGKYKTSCKGCHSVMDGFRGAFAKWDFPSTFAVHSGVNGTQGARAQADAKGVMTKLNKNETVYSGGYIVTNDSWINNANRGINSNNFGWRGFSSINSNNRGPASASMNDEVTGYGVNSFGALIANSSRFSQCMAKRVFDSVCIKSMSLGEQIQIMTLLGQDFERNNYNIKKLFESVITHSACH
ncbi:MAG: hypothetical protein K1X29_09275 [Bdellovibrionales bacterium]|nr:hypothetical protein [Bdellovibrionales bacterium]